MGRHVFVNDDDTDIVAQGFDAGVRLGEVIDSDMLRKSSLTPRQLNRKATPAPTASGQ
jgi:hypothetical protein